MRIRDKVLLSALVVGVLGSLAAAGVFGVFSATTTNAGNEISAGTVALSDNDAGSAMYNLNGATPGDTATSCIKVTYNGSLNSDVRLYSPDTVGVLAPYVDMTIEEGTQSSSTFPDCTGFTASGGPIYSGTLDQPGGDALQLRDRDRHGPVRLGRLEPGRFGGLPLHRDPAEQHAAERRSTDHG